MKQNWEYSTFGQIMTPAKVERCKSRTDLPILSITMHDGIVFQSSRFKKVIASVSTENYKIVRNGQLVIAFPIDEGLIYTQDVVGMGIMSPAYNVWDVDYTKVERRFLVKYFHSPNAMRYYKLKLRGTTQRRRNLPKEDLLSMPIPIPPLVEQSRIVAELDLLTGIIDKQNAQLKELDNLAQAIFYDMFGDPIENPKGWEIKTIQSVAEKYSDGPFGSNLKSEHYQQDGVRIIRLQNIGVNEFVDLDKAFISEEHYEVLKKYSCYPGDVVIGTLGEPNLRACVIPNSIHLAVNKADCILCRLKKDLITAIYFSYVMNEEKFVHAQCQAFSHGQTRARISAGQLKNAFIPLPPLTLQQSFAEKIQSIEKQKETIRASIADTQKLLDYTMDKYFG